MSEEATPEQRVVALEQQLAELQATHRGALLNAALRSEALRAGMVDLDGLKLVDTQGLTLDDNGELAGASGLMTTMKRAKPWLFGLPGPGAASSSSAATAPPAQAPRQRRATDMTHEEWQTARAELLRRR
jgi:hypothetical protein